METGVLRTAPAGDTRITLANEEAYFCGFADFSTRPMGSHLPGEMGGLWDPPLRLLTGFNVRIRGRKALPSGLCMSASRAELDYGVFTIDVSMPKDVLMFIAVRNECGNEVQVSLDMNLRPMWLSDFDTRHMVAVLKGEVSLEVPSIRRTYVLKTDARNLSASASEIRAGDNRDFTMALYRITGKRRVDAVTALKRTALNNKMRSLNTVLETDDGELSQAFYWAKHSLVTLTHRQDGIGRGLTAGHCDFPWYFSVDFFYSIDALLETGMSAVARDTLKLFIRHARAQGGRVPHEIVTNGVIYNPGDLEESAMLTTAMLKYATWSGDTGFARSHFRDAIASLHFVNSMKFVGPGIMEDATRGHSVEIDTLSYFIEGVESLIALRSMAFGRESSVFAAEIDELRMASEEAAHTVNRVMWSNDLSTHANRLSNGVPEYLGFWTSIVPFLTGIASQRRYRSFVESENGLKSMTGGDGLQIGSQMPKAMAIQNGLMSLAASNYGDARRALWFYKRNISRTGTFMPGVVPEILNDPAGCYLQAWSSAAVIHPLVGGILGITPSEGRLRDGKRVGSAMEGLKISCLPFRGSKYDFEVVKGRVAGCSH